jgi:hypothetical protein
LDILGNLPPADEATTRVAKLASNVSNLFAVNLRPL